MHLKYSAILSLFVCALFGSAYSQTTFSELVLQLQKTPTDNALREKIIKLATAMKPIPEIPEDARRPFVRANTAIKNASAPADYANAIKLYQEALLLAPWWADAYYNLSKSQELHQEYDAAIQSLEFYLMTSPATADAREAQDHIYALEELRDKKIAADKAKAAAETPEAKEATMWLNLEGARFVKHNDLGGLGNYDEIAQIKGRMLVITIKIYAIASGGTAYGKSRPGTYTFDPIPLVNGVFTHISDQKRQFTIRPDGQAILETFPDVPMISVGIFNIER